MDTLRHYLSVYRSYLSNGISLAMSFRAHFILLILVDVFFYFSALGAVWFIFDHVDSIGVWSRNEFLFFIAFMLAIDQLHMAFVAANFWQFSEDLRVGNLDFWLLKPIGGIFCAFFRNVRPASMLNIFIPWSIMIWFGWEANLPLLSWILLPFMILLGLTLLVSLEILLSMSMFWTIESIGINFLRMQMQSLSRWPDFVYQYYFRKVFTVIVPVLLIGSAPVKFLLDYSLWRYLALMLVAIVATWGLIGVFWRIGLRRYESASS